MAVDEAIGIPVAFHFNPVFLHERQDLQEAQAQTVFIYLCCFVLKYDIPFGGRDVGNPIFIPL